MRCPALQLLRPTVRPLLLPAEPKITIGARNVLIQVHPAGDRSRVLSQQLVPNLVTRSGREVVAKIVGNQGYAPSSIGLGTDGTPTTDETTSLAAEVFRGLVTTRPYAGAVIAFQLFLAETDANGFQLREAAVFVDENWQGGVVAVGGGTLFSRVVFQPIDKNLATSMTLTFEYPITSG